ncbi:MAG TPA: hypothetical protein VGM12_18170 [Trebonia sp.]|jgi:hypothetical protein
MNHAIAAVALGSSGGHHGRGLGLIVLVIIIAVAVFFLVRWSRSRRNGAPGKDGN